MQELGKALSDPELKGSVFLVGGHTDAKGGDDYNQGLSERRAEAIKNYLTEKFGLQAENLVTVGYGKTQLKNTDNPTAREPSGPGRQHGGAVTGEPLENPDAGARFRAPLSLPERDDFSSNRHPALAYCWSMIFPKTGSHFSGSCANVTGRRDDGRERPFLLPRCASARPA